jgi:predicted small lipoprotein YifL
MKIVSQMLLAVFVIVTLAACGEMGKGPSRPQSSIPTNQSK